MSNVTALKPLPSAAITAQFGKYTLLGELASGGMARIYFASIAGPGGFLKPCVVKKVLPELQKQGDFSEMFVSEARVAALLNHPNIVQAFDFGQIDGDYFLALEFVEGASLLDVIKECRRLGRAPDYSIAVTVGIALCEALAYVHTARDPDGRPLNIIHRDLSPANVLVSSSGGVKLTDFGIVKSSASAVLSRPDVLKGKLLYMSPEQVERRSLDGRSDLYSLGLLLYELTTLLRPLSRATLDQSIVAVRAAQVTPPSEMVPGFPPELERILMKVLEKSPADRYVNAKAMQAELEAFRSEQRWTSGTNELAKLLQTLFPDGAPTSPTRLQPLNVTQVGFTRNERSSQAIDFVESIDIISEQQAFPPGSERSQHWKEIVLLILVGLTTSVAIWLLALS